MNRRIPLPCALLVILWATGCGTGLSPVQGVVLLDGNPLPNASIQFIPQGAGKDATGATDAEGKFTMSTNEPRDGVMAGTYKVVIRPQPVAAAPRQYASADEAMRAEAAAPPPMVPNFPVQYTRVDQTQLTQEVPVKEKPLVYELKSK